jgi:hypothetical protein
MAERTPDPDVPWQIYRSVLVALMESQGTYPSLLARATGLDESLIRRALDTRSYTFRYSSVRALARGLGVATHILGRPAPPAPRAWLPEAGARRSVSRTMGAAS